MKILFVGETEDIAWQIRKILREDETICWHGFYDLDNDFSMEEFDIAILDGTTEGTGILSILIKLKCHKLKPVLVFVGNISVGEENCIWGMGVTDVIKVTFTNYECSEKIDSSYSWKWYYDRQKCHNTEYTR